MIIDGRLAKSEKVFQKNGAVAAGKAAIQWVKVPPCQFPLSDM
jgi:hypothetical protein